ncbi:MAG: hypothetical protein LBE53_14525 [Paucimonas sp.]|jgi:hypothetical protein|uniref:hypothetical protein n=1 Tax=Pantoea sp. Cy-639 TaxID=2608360 RepID=UPI00142271B5|nr:hypothetical protein [Pantoea sp. Cy-639]MDR2308393.1 hypothetical protein [Paucimonas sp.]NIF15456.1 hypothetical protein [Pantoea sp. Cy-639]
MKSMTLLVIASVLSLAAHADDSAKTNCDARIAELENIHKTDGPGMHGGMAHDFKMHMKAAKDARAKGDMGKCMTSAEQAKTIFNNARGK